MNNELILKYAKYVEDNNIIDENKYTNYNIKKGLRNANGTGVIVGITKIGAVLGYKKENSLKIAQEGRLYYRDIEIHDLLNKVDVSKPHRFEQTMYLLLFSRLPNQEQLRQFKKLLSEQQYLPEEFIEDFILRKPSSNIMNQLQRTVLCLYSIDSNPDLITIENLTKQALSLIAKFPSLVAYNYNSYTHKFQNTSLVIHKPDADLTMAENILKLLRPDSNYTSIEANVLDFVLFIHAEHGAGNNSTFTTHVVSSTQTDTYSSISASIGSLKGPKHGGANEKVREMISDLKNNTSSLSNENIYNYLLSLINKEAFDKSGLIYGMGHAVYTISDPRAQILKKEAYKLAESKNMLDEYYLYEKVEFSAKQAFKQIKGADFEICANVDLYSALVYELLDIPNAVCTALFALSRVATWNAHRIEQIFSDRKIIRPAYISITNGGNVIE